MRVCLASLVLLAGLSTAAIVRASPTGADAAIAEIAELLGRNRVDEAVAVGERASAAASEDARVWLWLGRAYGRKAIEAGLLARAGWASKTRSAWERAVELAPESTEPRFDLMQYYLQAPGLLGGGLDKAKAQAEAIARIDAAHGLLAEGAIAMHEKDVARAERAWRAAVERAPGDHRVRVAWSGFLSREGRLDELFAFWNAQVAANPGDAFAWFQIARAAAIAGRELEAGLAALDRFSALERPSFDRLAAGAPEWRRGQILEQLGRIAEALAAYEAALAANPMLADAKRDRDRLAKAR